VDQDARFARLCGEHFWRVMRITDGINTTSGRLLTPVASKSGYLRVCLQKNDKQLNKSVHRLVALHHIPNLENKPQVNHKDGNKQHNDIDNLEWVTRSENMRHAFDNGLTVAPKGEEHYKSFLSDDQIASIRLRYFNGDSQAQLANEFEIGHEAMSAIVHGTTWKHLPVLPWRKRITHSSVKGVTKHACGKWQAQTYINGKTKYLGMFDTEMEAANVVAQSNTAALPQAA